MKQRTLKCLKNLVVAFTWALNILYDSFCWNKDDIFSKCLDKYYYRFRYDVICKSMLILPKILFKKEKKVFIVLKYSLGT